MKPLARFAATAALALAAALACAQDFPGAGVKLVVPLTPGSGADTAARAIAQALSRQWKQAVVVDNRPGAGGLIGTSAVVQAAPDGLTLLVQSAGYAANAAIYKKLPYDPQTSLVAVSLIGATPYVMVTAADGPFTSLQALTQAARARPDSMPFASVGVGSSTHFAAEYFAQAAGLRLVHVPYRGGPEAIQEVMAGRVAFTMASLSTALGPIKGGKLRALGVATAARSPAAPDIPTIAEQGFAGFDTSLWFGVWAPAGTPAAVVDKVNADIALALQDPDLVSAFGRIGIQPRSLGAAEFARFVRDESAKAVAIAKSARIEPQ